MGGVEHVGLGVEAGGGRRSSRARRRRAWGGHGGEREKVGDYIIIHALSMSLNVALLDADVSNVTYILVSSPLPTAIEALRRAIYEKNGDGALADSLLTSVTVGAVSYMYIFRISQNVELDDLDLSQVNGTPSIYLLLVVDAVAVVESSSFTPHDLVFPAFPAACMRSIVTNFLNAVRISIIDSVAGKPCVLGRLKTGFLISYATPSNEWSSAWVVPRWVTFRHWQTYAHIVADHILSAICRFISPSLVSLSTHCSSPRRLCHCLPLCPPERPLHCFHSAPLHTI